MAKRVITNNPAEQLFNTVPKQPEPARLDKQQQQPVSPTSAVASSAPTPESQKIPETAAHGRQSQAAKILIVAPQERTEARSKRKQILLQPSVHDRADIKCKKLGISMNEAINQLLKNWADME